MMSEPTEETYWAGVAADELGSAMAQFGIRFNGCDVAEDGDIRINFQSLRDAETLLTLAVDSDGTLGGFYDRATSSCLTLSEMAEVEASTGQSPDRADLDRAIDAGWVWDIHPSMYGRRVGWHVAVDVPPADANQLTANLNTLRNGGLV